jgi:nucleoside 2-deoxyribosyltransferase
MQIYFAGPLFTPYERTFIEECATKIRATGIDVWVPHEHAAEMTVDGKITAKSVFDKDFSGLYPSNAVVALLDGPMVDDGTACEIGMFYAFTRNDPSKKGILGLCTDSRAIRARENYEGKGINLYVLGAIEEVGAVYDNIDDIIPVLQQWKAELEG